MIAQTTNRNGSRLSTARAFLRPFRNRKNLHILLNSTVTKVLINTTTRNAYGVEVLVNGNKQLLYANKEVIVSGGKDLANLQPEVFKCVNYFRCCKLPSDSSPLRHWAERGFR